jgi:hypothetical protein
MRKKKLIKFDIDDSKEIMELVEEVGITDDDDDDNVVSDDYVSQSHTEEISFIELGIINSFFYDSYRGKYNIIDVVSLGKTDSIGRVSYGGSFDIADGFWFMGKINGDDNEYIFQTKIFVDTRNELVTQLHISVKNGITHYEFKKVYDKIRGLAFNNSEYKGRCLKIKLKENTFKGIEIIDIEPIKNELILTDVQNKFIEHFISRVSRGGSARYLLNGEPGTGKTESIREIARRLIPNVTFIIPEFETSNDLSAILEACEIFDTSVIIMDDIDLFLGSRDMGNYTRLLGQFLSFFDGVKKRKISLLASTNDKGLVDKAAERPGRFNFTLDYNFLDDEQIVKVCKIHLPDEYQLEEVYKALKGRVNGKKANITGAFIANLADNIREMAEDDSNWGLEDTLTLIEESYNGFYHSQLERKKEKLGFSID